MRTLFLVAAMFLALSTATALGARSSVVTPPATAAERDALIDKLARGEDAVASLARFIVLYKEREVLLLAEQKERDQQQQAQEQQVRDQQQRAALQHTLDYLVAQHCRLRVDPSKPENPTTSGSAHGDWGKVVRRELVAIKGKTAFDEDEPVTVYRVQGAERTYTVSSKSPTGYGVKVLQAAVGDLVLLCWSGLSTYGSGSYYPPEFRDNVIGSGFVARIVAPPRIVNKASWDPIHLTGESALRMAIERVTWKFPEGRPVLSYIHVLADQGQGRFEIAAEGKSYVLEVPSGLKNRELVQPGKYLWAIMSTPRFDKEIKKLVLRAEDLEAHYVQAVE